MLILIEAKHPLIRQGLQQPVERGFRVGGGGKQFGKTLPQQLLCFLVEIDCDVPAENRVEGALEGPLRD